MILTISIMLNFLYFSIGVLLVFLFFVYIYSQYLSAKTNRMVENSSHVDETPFKLYYIFFSFLGIFLLGYGSDLFIKGATGIAILFKVPLIIVSLSVVALGTSIPELVTSIVALKKEEPNLVIGNILGSNIINVLLVLGSSLLVNPINVSSYATSVSIFFVTIVTLLLLYWRSYRDAISRNNGFLLLLLYILFIYINTF